VNSVCFWKFVSEGVSGGSGCVCLCVMESVRVWGL
jgi:hypothetical protein